MDSLQNLLFSVCRFREITTRYPQRVTAISWSFKRTRFEKLHRRALRFPAERFTFVGADGAVNISQTAWRFERMAIELFKADAFGCDNKLKETRIARNPYFRSIPYPRQCPELNALFNICADAQGLDDFKLSLPWT